MHRIGEVMSNPEPQIYDHSGLVYWTIPGSGIVNGPFMDRNAAFDDITIVHSVKADRIIAIARACHEANRAFCSYIGDDSQVPWDEASDGIKQSALDGVEFHFANPDAGDSASHDNWSTFKINHGWVYGEVKSEELKTHPCLVAFDKLPKDQQFKDKLFRTIVHAVGMI